MILLISAVLFGTLIGVAINHQSHKFSQEYALKLFKKQLYVAYEEGIKYGVVKPKIDRINEISKEQINYMGALDRPNASAAHSRHKNRLISSIKSLEAEKISLFKSILESGFDPFLNVVIDGESKGIRVSELASYLETGELPQETTETKTDPISPSNAIPKLRIVKSIQENDDVTTLASDPTVH